MKAGCPEAENQWEDLVRKEELTKLHTDGVQGVGQGRSLDLHNRRRMCGEMGSFLFLKMGALRKTRER